MAVVAGRLPVGSPARRLPPQVAARMPAVGDRRRALRPRGGGRARPRAGARVRRRGRGATGAPSPRSGHAPGLIVFAIDTELLGHWWWEGPVWLEEVLATAAEHGVELVTLGEAARRHPPEARAASPLELGRGQGPAHLGLAPGRRPRLGRAPARAAAAARPRRGPARPAPPSARRASCSRSRRATGRSSTAARQAGDYPWQRTTDHARALLEALNSASDPPDPRLRNLAPDLCLSPLLEP